MNVEKRKTKEKNKIQPFIYTINARQLFNYYPKQPGVDLTTPYCLDIRKYYNFCQVLNQTSEFEECPLYHQFLYSEQLQKDKIKDTNKADWLLDKLVIVDFGNVFSGQKESVLEKAKDLMGNGLDIQFTKDHRVHMLPFDKSGNMSRTSRITFINEAYYKEMNQRLNLGMDFSDMKVVLSKYYAYRGLYLSTSRRVTSKKVVLTEETLVIIKDRTDDLVGSAPDKNIKIETAKSKGINEKTNREEWEFGIIKDEKTKKIDTPYDGQGFITPDYSWQINKQLRLPGASSYQIRLPFAKGMLHQVDVQGFLNEFDPEEMKKGSYSYTDAFGIERDLKKARIFLTESMFKGMKWLKEHCEKNHIADPMKYYCDMLNTYNHALYISGTDLPYGHSSYTHLSYQMLNTLALNEEQFKSIVDGHTYFIKHPEKFLKVYNERESREEDLTDEKAQSTCQMPAWKQAVLEDYEGWKNDKYIKSQLRGTQKGLLTKLLTGKLLVKGQTRYLCRDLLPLLYMLLGKDEISEEEYFTFLWGRAYLPMGKGTEKTILERADVGYNDYLALFRSPHLSRNEQCIVQPFVLPKPGEKFHPIAEKKNEPGKHWVDADAYREHFELYQKYFGHLTGVVMLPRGSVMPLCLGGADFDGDLVNVVFQKEVADAVYKGCSYHWINRELPIVEIPSIKSEKETVPCMVPYTHVLHTFSNRIGFLSNTAISIGQTEYNRKGEKETEKNDVNKLTCSKCTILTGLEIDAAKNGIHPSLEMIENHEIEKAEYLRFIDEYKKLKSNPHFVFDGMKINKTPGEDPNSYFIEIEIKDCEERPKILIDGSGTYINQLPEEFMKAYQDYKECIRCQANTKKDDTRTTEADSTGFHMCTDSDDKNVQKTVENFAADCRKIINLYFYYKRIFIRNLSWEKKKTGYGEKNLSKLILKLYNSEQASYVQEEIIPSLKDKFDRMIPAKDSETMKKVLENVNTCQWQFRRNEEEKEAALKVIIGNYYQADRITEEEKNILFHFRQQGYKLLWHLLTSIKDSRKATFEEIKEKTSGYLMKEQEKNNEEDQTDFTAGAEENGKAEIENDLEELIEEADKIAKRYYEENLTGLNEKIEKIHLQTLVKVMEWYQLESASVIRAFYEITEQFMDGRCLFWKTFSWDEIRNSIDREEMYRAE